MKIAIIGLGYVGLPLSLQFVSAGVEVIGLDVDFTKVEALRSGRSYIKHIGGELIANAVREGRFEPSNDFSKVADVEAVIICVPTPLSKHREPDISYVLATGRSIAPYIGNTCSLAVGERVENNQTVVRNLAASVASVGGGGNSTRKSGGGPWISGARSSQKRTDGASGWTRTMGSGNGERKRKLIILESTTYPGTTDEDLRAVLEEGSGGKAGVDFHLAFSPEREDPANPLSQVGKIPKVVGGLTPTCRERAMELYGKAIETLVPVSSCRAAEATKLLENIFRSVNIALVNELKLVYGAMDIDIWEVIDAAKTKPFGFMPFYPGPGLGGHCIPIDPFYLTWKAREYGQHTRFIELAGEINAGMPRHVVSKIAETLNEKGMSLRDSRVLLLGLAYKAEVDDVRESPSFTVMEELAAKGAMVAFYDPFIPEIPPTHEHARWTGTKSVEWNRETISAFDCVVICTAHREVDYGALNEWGMDVVDTRNVMAPLEASQSSRVIKA